MIVAVFFVAVIVALMLVSISRRPRNFPPGPVLLPLVGYYPLINHKNPLSTWEYLYKKWGPLVGLVLGTDTVVIVGGLKASREVLLNEACQGRPDVCLIRDRFNGENYGVVFTEGEVWKCQRRFILHHLRNMGFGSQSHEATILDEVQELLQQITSHENHPFLLKEHLVHTTINIIWSLVGGHRFKHNDPALKKAAFYIHTSLHGIQSHGNVAVAAPFLRHLFPGFTGVTNIKRSSEGLQEFIRDFMRVYKPSIDLNEPKDFIEIYMSELAKENKDPSFTAEQLMGVVIDLLAAAVDTTSATLSFVILFCCLHPSIQEKVQQEIDQVIGGDRLPTSQDRAKLPFTWATLLETLRMRNPLPVLIAHRTTQDTVISGYNVPKHTYLLINQYSVHMDKEYWGDPEKFRPERFIDPSGNLKKDEYMMPFGKGKRSCLGESLARMATLIIFSSLLQNFTFRLNSGDPVPSCDPVPGFTFEAPYYRIIADPRRNVK